MRVLHVITGLGIGGAEQQLRLLVGHLPVHSSVVTLTNPGAVADALRADGVPVAHLGMRGNRDLSALPRLTGLIRRGRYDVVHTHLYRACVYGRLAARLAGVRRVIATEHSLGAAQIEGRPLSSGARALYLATERLGTATVAVSDTVARRLADWGVRPSRVRVVPNGIDAARFAYDEAARHATRRRLGLPPDAYVVGGGGRLAPGKRFDTLLHALPELPPDVRLLIVGEGAERSRLARLAASRGVTDRVVWAGAVGAGELPGLLSAMDVFVASAADEAFGLAVVEALAAGLPVRYVACPALDDLPPGEAPGALRIGGTAADVAAAVRTTRAEGARRLPVPPAAHRYDIAHSARQLMTLYSEPLPRLTRETSDR
ncbi:glycosyltransferase [Streptomyces sp. CC77]|uniref:glycosyltransferase n=1 Tax=Streptomyces sp. CC77 TaxID=1906739 RepID=UPI0008DD5870|nr:glycosyltransferase [Streptomyces sp. CC77]OII70489.1 glycosyl transferase [Streptomyces sp. CC77]